MAIHACRKVNRYLDIEDRVNILNNRLDIVNDLLEGLSGQLEIRCEQQSRVCTRPPQRKRRPVLISTPNPHPEQIKILQSYHSLLTRNSHRLEIIVILLIAVEILLELFPHGTFTRLGSQLLRRLAAPFL